MSKKIEDYLPYYIGQDCMIGDYKGKIQSVGSKEIDFMCVVSGTNQDEESGFYGEDEENDVKPEMVKPILRPLSDMTEEEAKEVVNRQFKSWSIPIYEGHSSLCIDVKFQIDVGNKFNHTQIDYDRISPDAFHYLLKQGFDLFNLIPAGLAVDKTKEVTNATN